MWSLPPPQIYQKHIYKWKESHRTSIECWQKTSERSRNPPHNQVGKKKKVKEKGIRMGPAPHGGSCEG